MLLLGEAGTGKTRFVHELARASDTELVRGHGVDYAATPYAPFAEIWRTLEVHDPGVLAKRPALKRALLAELVPPGGAPADASLDDRKRAAFDAAAAVLRYYAARRPLTLVLEDAQWSDLASLELVHHLALTGRDLPVLLVVTVRESELAAERLRMVTRLGRLPRASRIDLHALEPADAAQLLEHELRRAGLSLLAALEVGRGPGRGRGQSALRARAGAPSRR